MQNKKQSIVSEKDLKLLWRIIKANWYIPLFIVPFFYLAGYFYAYKQTLIYQVSTQILLNKNDDYYKGNLVTDASAYYIDNANETRIISSYDLMKETVSRLKDRLQVSYFIVGRVNVVEQFSGVPFSVKVNNINPRFAETKLDFKISDYDHFEISFMDGGQAITRKGEFGKELITVEFNLLVNRAPSLSPASAKATAQVNYQVEIHSIERLIGIFQRKMKVTNPDYTNILDVSIVDIIPERAMIVLDTLNKVYEENTLKSKYELNEKTITYIDKQLQEISDTLKNIQDTMQNYKESKNILDLEWERTDYFAKLSEYDKMKSNYQLQIEALNDLEKYIIEDKDPQFLPPNVYVFEKAGFMSAAVNDLYQKQMDLNNIYGVAKENYPKIGELKQSIKRIKEYLLTYIENTRKATVKTIENVNGQITDYIGTIRTIPKKQRDIFNIQRKVNISENLYNFLLERRANTRIAKASIVPNVKVIEQPRNMGVVEPDKPKIIKQYLSFGLIISVLFILIRTFFYSRIKTVDHLSEMTELPIIGALPLQKNVAEKSVVVDEQPNSKIAEAFRNFRTNLQYANIDMQSRTFLVTSYLPGEGKTFISINLATLLAKTGKRVVLLELDLHKPRIYKVLGEQPKQGISTFLIGQSKFEDIISPTNIENLYCMFAGPVPPNPSELVLSEKMKEMIQLAKENFDYVIIDTPPAGLLSDAIYMMQFADASMFVINTKVATKREITFLHDIVKMNNIKNMFLILNGIKSISRRYYYKGYGYTYGYGYGYGYGKSGYGNN